MLGAKGIAAILAVVLIIIIIAGAVGFVLIRKRVTKSRAEMQEGYDRLSRENRQLRDQARKQVIPEKKKAPDPLAIDYIYFKDGNICVMLKSGDIVTPDVTPTKLIFKPFNKEYRAVVKSFNLDAITATALYIGGLMRALHEKYGRAFDEKYGHLDAAMGAFTYLYINWSLSEEMRKKNMTGMRLLDKAVNLFHEFTSNTVYKTQISRQLAEIGNKQEALKLAIQSHLARAPACEMTDIVNDALNDYMGAAGEYAFNFTKMIEDLEHAEETLTTGGAVTVESTATKDDIQGDDGGDFMG